MQCQLFMAPKTADNLDFIQIAVWKIVFVLTHGELERCMLLRQYRLFST